MLELQVSAVAIRSKLIPFIFMVFELCFYRLLFVNEASVRNAFTILSIYEVIHIPVFLYRYFNYKQTGFQYIPKALLNFFQSYWALLTKFQSNKI